MVANLNKLLESKIINRWNLFWLITVPVSFVMALTMTRVDLTSGEAVSSMIQLSVRCAVPLLYLAFAGIIVACDLPRIVQPLAGAQSTNHRAFFRCSHGLAVVVYRVAGRSVYAVLRGTGLCT